MTISTTERAPERLASPDAGARTAPVPQVSTSGLSAVRVAFGRMDALAMVVLTMLSVALFGPHVLGLGTFIGNSDRLHTFLNMREFEVHALQTLGRVPAWSDATF